MAMATAILGGAANDNDHGRAKFQVRVTTCDTCAQTFFEGGGRKIPVTAADAARADCDAQRLGADERAAQDIPPKTRREVIHRDGGKCAVPRCRSARFTEIHHVVPRSEGGSHDASNLCCLCDGHHKLLHEGKLRLSGRAANIVVRFASDPVPHVETHVAARHIETSHVETKPSAFAAAVASVERVAASSEGAPQETAAAARHVEAAISHVETRHVSIPHVETKPNAFVAAVAKRGAPSTGRGDGAPVVPHVVAPMPHVETRAPARYVEAPMPHAVAPQDLDAIPHVETRPNAFAAAASVKAKWADVAGGPDMEHVQQSHVADPMRYAEMATQDLDAIPHVETQTAARRLDAEIPHVGTRPHKLEVNAYIETAESREAKPNAYAAAVMRADAKQALTQLGFAPAASAKYVAAALASDSHPLTLEALIRLALRYSR